jgi:hypothetical protein
MQEAAQQPILIKRTMSVAEKSSFRWIKCSSDGGATKSSVTTLDPDATFAEALAARSLPFLSIFFHFRMKQV